MYVLFPFRWCPMFPSSCSDFAKAIELIIAIQITNTIVLEIISKQLNITTTISKLIIETKEDFYIIMHFLNVNHN